MADVPKKFFSLQRKTEVADVTDPLISGPIRGALRADMLGLWLRLFRLGLRLKLTKAKNWKQISNVHNTGGLAHKKNA